MTEQDKQQLEDSLENEVDHGDEQQPDAEQQSEEIKDRPVEDQAT